MTIEKKYYLGKTIFSEKQIHDVITTYANKINQEYKEKKLTIIIILNGAVFFGIELIKKLKINLEMDFLGISSYVGDCKKEKIKFYKELKIDLNNKDVLVIEDIVDSGKTSQLIYNFIKKFSVKSVKICSLIRIMNNSKYINNKDWTHLLKMEDNTWIVGFGLDYEEEYRHLKDIKKLIFKK